MQMPLRVARVEGRLDRDDQLRDDGQDLGAAVLEHVEDALDGAEAVRLLLLAEAVKKDGGGSGGSRGARCPPGKTTEREG